MISKFFFNKWRILTIAAALLLVQNTIYWQSVWDSSISLIYIGVGLILFGVISPWIKLRNFAYVLVVLDVTSIFIFIPLMAMGGQVPSDFVLFSRLALDIAVIFTMRNDDKYRKSIVASNK